MSSHNSQYAARQRERHRRAMRSPEGRRIPVTPSLPSAQLNGQTLSADLADQLAALPPLSEPHPQHSHHFHATVPNVSFSCFSTL
jgi:hypothetical protein